jgi:hypothetical protein
MDLSSARGGEGRLFKAGGGEGVEKDEEISEGQGLARCRRIAGDRVVKASRYRIVAEARMRK